MKPLMRLHRIALGFQFRLVLLKFLLKSPSCVIQPIAFFRVSYYQMSIDDGPREKQKSSGVTVCTGTGSTSWFFHINHALAEDVKTILDIGEL